MKILKYLLLIFGVLGIIATVYNTIQEGTLSGQKIGLISSIFLIFASFGIEKWAKTIKK